MKNTFAALALACCTLPALAQQAASDNTDPLQLQDRIVGDIGGGVFHLDRNGLSRHSHNLALPYAYFDYERFFARVDTFGIKTVRMGYGYLELAGRLNFEGFDADRGLHRRSNPIPLGLGTYQETPIGAFFLNAFYDFNTSHGTLAEAIYAAQVDIGRVSIYPQIGVEYRSANYNNYYFGIDPNEASASGLRQYTAGASTSPILGLSADVPLTGDWKLNLTWRRKWLDSSVTNSPLIHHRAEDTAIVALSYHFK